MVSDKETATSNVAEITQTKAMATSTAVKATIGRALRETGAALKNASGLEVCRHDCCEEFHLCRVHAS